MRRRLYAAALTLLLACASTPDLSDVAKDFVTLEGTLVTEPALEAKGERLFIYLRTPGGELLTCMARNKEREAILDGLRTLLIAGMGHNTIVYGLRVDEPIEEIIGGVDYEVYAVGVWVPEAGKHRVVLTSYGDGLKGALANVSWTDFLQRVLGKGMDAL